MFLFFFLVRLELNEIDSELDNLKKAMFYATLTKFKNNYTGVTVEESKLTDCTPTVAEVTLPWHRLGMRYSI